jgi:hypothetical protein
MASRAQNSKDLASLYKMLFIELPVAGSKAALGLGKDGALEETVWKAYDAGIRLINRSTDSLYQNPFFGDAIGRSLPGLLQTQRLTSAVSGAAFAAWRSATGLAGASEVHAVRSELRDLRHDLRSLIAALPQPTSEAEQVDPRDDQAEEDFIRALDGQLHSVSKNGNQVARAA